MEIHLRLPTMEAASTTTGMGCCSLNFRSATLIAGVRRRINRPTRNWWRTAVSYRRGPGQERAQTALLQQSQASRKGYRRQWTKGSQPHPSFSRRIRRRQNTRSGQQALRNHPRSRLGFPSCVSVPRSYSIQAVFGMQHNPIRTHKIHRSIFSTGRRMRRLRTMPSRLPNRSKVTQASRVNNPVSTNQARCRDGSQRKSWTTIWPI